MRKPEGGPDNQVTRTGALTGAGPCRDQQVIITSLGGSYSVSEFEFEERGHFWNAFGKQHGVHMAMPSLTQKHPRVNLSLILNQLNHTYKPV